MRLNITSANGVMSDLPTYLLQQWQLRSATWTSLRPLIDSPLTLLVQNWRGIDGKLGGQGIVWMVASKEFQFTGQWKPTMSDVPQGSVLGKTLFAIFLSAPACGMECPPSRFAGDSKLSQAWMGLREGMPSRGTWTGLRSGPMRATSSSTRPSANASICSLYTYAKPSLLRRRVRKSPRGHINANSVYFSPWVIRKILLGGNFCLSCGPGDFLRYD